MIPRAKIGIFKPKIYAVNLDVEEPGTYNKAMQSENWKAAMQEEYNALIKNNTWELVTKPEH